MRHNVVNNKFRMKTSHRIATFRNMTVSLIENGKIETTLDKAKVFSDYNEAKNKATELGLYAFNLMLISVTEEGY